MDWIWLKVVSGHKCSKVEPRDTFKNREAIFNPSSKSSLFECCVSSVILRFMLEKFLFGDNPWNPWVMKHNILVGPNMCSHQPLEGLGLNHSVGVAFLTPSTWGAYSWLQNKSEKIINNWGRRSHHLLNFVYKDHLRCLRYINNKHTTVHLYIHEHK